MEALLERDWGDASEATPIRTPLLISLYSFDGTPVMQNPAALRCYGNENKALHNYGMMRVANC